MIALIEPMPAGNAVRLILSPPEGAADWRVLRRANGAITGPADPGAVVVAEWGRAEAIMDTDGLVNGVPITYRPFYRTAAGQPMPLAPARTVTPAATARDTSARPLRLLRERIGLAMAAAVADGRLHPASGRVPVVLAAMVDPGKTTFPIVSVHLESDAPMGRAVADYIAGDELAGLDGWDVAEGWLSEVTINVVAVSLNPDERVVLGEVLKHAIASNLAVLNAHGLIRPAFTLSHAEPEPPANAAPLYVASGTFTCIAPTTSTAQRPEVADVAVRIRESSP